MPFRKINNFHTKSSNREQIELTGRTCDVETAAPAFVKVEHHQPQLCRRQLHQRGRQSHQVDFEPSKLTCPKILTRRYVFSIELWVQFFQCDAEVNCEFETQICTNLV